jgi:nucleoside-diphosphate-sugar epimerase
MKIALTGHTSGIGKEFAEALKDQKLKCFSRSNGYSIDTKTERDRIVREAQDCDSSAMHFLMRTHGLKQNYYLIYGKFGED